MPLIRSVKIFTFLLLLNVVTSENKYSKEANTKKDEKVDFRNLQKPFRMAKLNLLWTKAQQRLTEPKLQSLYSELKMHDKEEITFKRVKSEGGDKDGLREAELRKKLLTIMKNYNLLEHFEDMDNIQRHKDHMTFTDDNQHLNSAMFKDKKLNQLWRKAELSGFTPEELKALHEEFNHHQDKIEQYYSLLDEMGDEKEDIFKNAVNEDEHERFNDISFQLENEQFDKKDYLDKANLVRNTHRQIRDSYDHLQIVTSQGRTNQDFVEPKVLGLWRSALQANFTAGELHSLRDELRHLESRLQKLRQMHAEHASNSERYNSKMVGDKTDHADETQKTIKKQEYKVETLHKEIELRILKRHSEL